jgi:hypothetical protein
MIETILLKSCNPIVDISIPSITIFPAAASSIRKSAKVKDDFPAPVLPTTPTRSPPWMVNVTSRRQRSSSGRYRILKPLLSSAFGQKGEGSNGEWKGTYSNSMDPFEGHDLAGFFSGISAGASDGNSP